MTERPALSAAEWNGVLHQADGLAHLREEFAKLPFSAHAVAALLLYDQPFGFTRPLVCGLLIANIERAAKLSQYI